MPTVHFEVVRHEEQARRPPRIAIMCGISAFGFKSGVPEAAQQWLKDSVISLHHRGSDERWLMSELTVGAARVAAGRIIAAEQMRLREAGPHKDHYRSHDLAGIVEHVIEMTPVVSPSGRVYRFTDEDIEKVKALDLDLLIRCGSGILRGNILRASRLGVVSFHHGDNRVNRGGPAGFWECYYRWPRTGFIIQRLTEELDGGDVLVRGFFATRHYYSLNQAHVYKKSLTHLKALLGKVASTGELPQTETGPAPYSSILFRAPNLVQCVVYACKLLT